MALSKKNVDIIFSEGVNNKTDDKLTLENKLLTLENAVFVKNGQLTKRNGYNLLSSFNDNLKSILKYDNELLVNNNSKLYSYSQSNDEWIEKGNVNSVFTKNDRVIFNNKDKKNFDSNYKDGLTIYSWSDVDGVFISIKDDNNNSFIVSNKLLSSTGHSSKILQLNNYFFVFFFDDNKLKYHKINIEDPTNRTFEFTLRDNIHSDFIIDAINVNEKGYLFLKNGNEKGLFLEMNSLGSITNIFNFDEKIVSSCGLTYNSRYDEFGLTSVVFDADLGYNRAYYYSFDANLNIINQFWASFGIGDVKIEKVTILEPLDNDRFLILAECDPVGDYAGELNSNKRILKISVGFNQGATSAGVFLIKSIGLASKMFLYNNNIYFCGLHESPLQATLYIIDINGNIVAKFAQGNAGTFNNISNFCNIVFKNDHYSFLYNVKGTILSENNKLFSKYGLVEGDIYFDYNYNLNYTNINNNLYIAGNVLSSYDGVKVTEQGFFLYPEGAELSSTVDTGGEITDGERLYACVYSWIDAKGNIIKSSSSTPFQVVNSEGTGTQKNIIKVPTCRLTNKDLVAIEIYRTENAGTILYKTSFVDNELINNKDVDFLLFEDILKDEDILSNEILYVNGGILDSIQADSCDIVTTHKNRIFSTSLNYDNEIRYSKIIRDFQGAGFNEALTIKVDPKGGKITGLSSLDSNLIIFKENNIYGVTGEGPSDTGNGATFTEPQLISSDVGCVSQNTIVLGSDGLYFKSNKGIYLLTRNYEVIYIGANVENFNNYDVTSASLISDKNEIRFSTLEGYTLVYNYYFRQWSVFTGLKTIDSIIWNNKYTYLNNEFQILQENYNTYLDNNQTVKMKIGTGWLKVSGLQGFQRLYRSIILGDYKSRHRLKLSIYNDYSNVLKQTDEFITNEILSVDSGFYGDGVYGEGEVYGGTHNGVYQFQTHIKYQKSQAVRFVIEDIIDNDVDYGNGESFTINGITLEIGRKRGLKK